MAHQLTKNRVASGFSTPVGVAAKSCFFGVVQNEAGVVKFPDGTAYAGRSLHAPRARQPSRSCRHRRDNREDRGRPRRTTATRLIPSGKTLRGG